MAFSRHNIEKRRLIELVRLNPILWDCRLPHYKRSDKKKAIKWNELGRMFNVNGERVQRTFTSLREIFRRELNHEKMLGTTRFKSKWEYYDAMAFLKEVIRERKSRERIKHSSIEGCARNNNNSSSNNNNNNNNNSVHNSSNNNGNNSSNNNSSSATHDEYQYFAPSDPNNPNNQAIKSSQIAIALQQAVAASTPGHAPALAIGPAPAPAPAALLPNLSQLPVGLQQQAQHLQALQLQPDVTLTSLKATPTPTPTVTPTQMPTQLQTATPTAAAAATATAAMQVCNSSRSCSSSPSIYIKDEPDSADEAADSRQSTATRRSRSVSQSQLQSPQKLATIRTRTKQQLKTRLQVAQCGKVGGPLYATPPPHLIINTNNELIDVDAGDLDDDDDDLEYDDEDEDDEDVDDDDDDDDDVQQVVGDAVGRRGQIRPPLVDADMLGMGAGRLSPGSSFTAAGAAGSGTPRRQASPREMLYIKFGDFLAARLNTLHESTANELMNKILLLIAEK
ncbi:hypothetical protein KR222_001058 [Zaprionus bogoriensis]|nr:hypothetical protein KR222_001058 [Zaprionus bogoriensis]